MSFHSPGQHKSVFQNCNFCVLRTTLCVVVLLALTTTVSPEPRRRKEPKELNVTKCRDASEEKCEQVEHIVWKPASAVCPLYAQTPFTPWLAMLKTFNPPFECVNHKGTFTIRNLTIDDRARRVLPLGKGFWIIKLEIFDETLKPFACFRITAGE